MHYFNLAESVASGMFLGKMAIIMAFALGCTTSPVTGSFPVFRNVQPYEEHDMNTAAISHRCHAAIVCQGVARCLLTLVILCGWIAATATQVRAGSKTCGSFYLRNGNGDVINPLTGENSDQPFSTRKTCGACHDYDRITKGYHFQQGWDRISDTFNKEKPWELSDGMMGKH